jgi:hypothetical protein
MSAAAAAEVVNSAGDVRVGASKPGDGVSPAFRLAVSAPSVPADGTVRVRAALTGAPASARVRFQLDGVLTEERTAGPYEIAVTAPHGVEKFAVTAIALDESGRTLAVAEEQIRVSPAEVRPLELRIAGSDGKLLRSEPITVWANGLRATYFDFDRPLVAMPELDEETPTKTRYVASLDRRNPDSVFGRDPWALDMSPDYAARFAGWLRVPRAGEYRFAVRSQEGARLRIGNAVVVDVPGGASRSRGAEGVVTLPEGLVRLTVDHYETVADPELVVEWAPPGEPLGSLPKDVLWTTLHGEELATDSAGRLRLPSAPTHLGPLLVWHAESASAATIDPNDAGREQRLKLQPNMTLALEASIAPRTDLNKENR